LVSSDNQAKLSFVNYDDEVVEIPFIMDNVGQFNLGESTDLVNNPDEGFYLEGDVCSPVTGDWTDCASAQFLVVVDNVAHVIELASVDDPDTNDPEVDFDDMTYGTSTNNNDYGSGAASCSLVGDTYECFFNLGSGVGQIQLNFNTLDDSIVFADLGDGSVMFTQNKGSIEIADLRNSFDFTENVEENAEIAITVGIQSNIDNTAIQINPPTGFEFYSVDKSDIDSDNQMYYSTYGTIAQYDSEDKDDLTIWHPKDRLYVDVFLAPTNANTIIGDPGNCTIKEILNPIPSSVNKFDTEISDPTAYNLVSVGSPCNNLITAQLMGYPEVCYSTVDEGRAILKLFINNDKYQMVVYGRTDEDTKKASQVLQNWEDYEISGMDMEVITASESGLTVKPVTG